MQTQILREAYIKLKQDEINEAVKSYKDIKDAIKTTIKELTPSVAGNAAYSKDDQFGVAVDALVDKTGEIPLAFIFEVFIGGKVDRIDVVKIGSDEYNYLMKDLQTKRPDNKFLSLIAEQYYDMIK